ncbi:MAG: hypothetical protein VX863_04305 [Candidatus Thermoplasmatota archaeon]|nr:hypothetical protein [Candidatus Thermoplasmatota archaeon]MEC9335897.1 hypothetical protein [Candidatus Thermoplasmatota archaeon]
MIFTIAVMLLLVGLIASIFLWQKFYNPGQLCAKCYRVLPLDVSDCPWCNEPVDE